MSYCDIEKECKNITKLKEENKDLKRIILQAIEISQMAASGNYNVDGNQLIIETIQGYELLRYNIIAKLNEVNKWM